MPLFSRKTSKQNLRLTIVLTYFAYVTTLLASSRYSDKDMTIQQFAEKLLDIGTHNMVADKEFEDEHLTFILNYLVYLRNVPDDHSVYLHDMVNWINTGKVTRIEA